MQQQGLAPIGGRARFRGYLCDPLGVPAHSGVAVGLVGGQGVGPQGRCWEAQEKSPQTMARDPGGPFRLVRPRSTHVLLLWDPEPVEADAKWDTENEGAALGSKRGDPGPEAEMWGYDGPHWKCPPDAVKIWVGWEGRPVDENWPVSRCKWSRSAGARGGSE